MATPEEVLTFWLDEIGSDGWYSGNAALDAQIRERFETSWQQAPQGGYGLWLTYPRGVLAYSILHDQLPRNMFRGTARAFSNDRQAITAVKAAIDKNWDCQIDEPARQFFYLPLMHSENACDQNRAVRLILTRMPKTGKANLLHARTHREVIRRFGRFPWRNAALGRPMMSAEAAFMASGGYEALVREIDNEKVV